MGRLPRALPFLPYALAGSFLVGALVTTSDFIAIPADTAQQLTVARSLFRGEGYLQPVVWAHSGLADSVTDMPDTHGILWPFVQAAWFAVLSEDSSTVRVHGLVYLALTGLVAFLFARRLFGAAAGTVAMILVLTNPNLFLFAVMAVDDVSFAFFFLCAALLLHRALESGESQFFWLAGAASGVATLAKAIGFFLPLVFLSTFLLRKSRESGSVGRNLVALSLPFSLGAAAYFARNLFAHGDLGFRFSAMEWIYKQHGFEALAAVFDPPPTMGDIVEVVGSKGLLLSGISQLDTLLASTLRVTPLLVQGGTLLQAVNEFWLPAFLPLLGVLFAIVLLRSQRSFAVLSLLAAVGLAGFVSFLYHFELRYFAALIPLAAIAISSGVAHRPWPSAASQGRRIAAGAGLVVALLTAGLSAVQFALLQHSLLSLKIDSRVCADSLDWIARATDPADRVLAMNPWHVAWFTERESVLLPSGGIAEIEVVARHYEAHWLLVAVDLKRPETSQLLARLDRVRTKMTVETVYRGRFCRVDRLDWDG